MTPFKFTATEPFCGMCGQPHEGKSSFSQHDADKDLKRRSQECYAAHVRKQNEARMKLRGVA